MATVPDTNEENIIRETLSDLSMLREDGRIELMKILLSVSCVVLTVFVSLLPQGGIPSYDTKPLLVFSISLTVASLLLCIGFGFYHLHYAWVMIQTNKLDKIKQVLRENNSVSSAATALLEVDVAHSFLYKASTTIAVVAFYISILSLCAVAFIKT
jgi:hypothetical protein